MRLRRRTVDIGYLSDGWNRLDFFVVITSWPTMVLEVADISLPMKTSSLRALRVMRVMRSMRFFGGIKRIISALARTVSSNDFWNICGFLAFVYLILGAPTSPHQAPIRPHDSSDVVVGGASSLRRRTHRRSKACGRRPTENAPAEQVFLRWLNTCFCARQGSSGCRCSGAA